MDQPSLNFIEAKTLECAQSIWPNVKFSVRYKPLVNLNFGDIGSEFLLGIAEVLKEAPDTLGQIFLSKINSLSIPGSFALERGFINYCGPDTEGWLSTVETPKAFAMYVRGTPEYDARTPEASTFVLLPKRPAHVSIPGYLRLACRAYLQLKMIVTQGGVAYTNSGDTLTQVTLENIYPLFNRVLDQIEVAESEIRSSDFEKFLNLAPTFRTSIWLTPDLISKKMVRQLILLPARAEGRLSIHMPSNRWCYGGDQNGWRTTLSSLRAIKDGDQRLIYYGSSNINADEIDWSTPIIQESANTWWWRSFLMSRVETHSKNMTPLNQSMKELSMLERRMLIRIKFLKIFQESAALLGNIEDYLIVVKDLLTMFNRYFNDPNRRGAMTENRLSQQDYQIISGVYDAMKII